VSSITDIVRELDVHIFTPDASTAVCDSSWDQFYVYRIILSARWATCLQSIM
jgi:hypothetical protein